MSRPRYRLIVDRLYGSSAASEVLTALFVDYPDAPADIATELDFSTVTLDDVRKARALLLAITQESLRARGLPDQFVVYRAGHPNDPTYARLLKRLPITATTLDLRVARRHAGLARQRGADAVVCAYRIGRDDVLADVERILGPSSLLESELLVDPARLTLIECEE